MARMGHDSERAALIYQKHEARGADQTITNAIDAHVQGEQSRPTMTTTARPGRSSPLANGTLMARKATTDPTGVQCPDRTPLTWGYSRGAGDGNRTRTISLGS